MIGLLNRPHLTDYLLKAKSSVNTIINLEQIKLSL
jgi:hypothetical protein